MKALRSVYQTDLNYSFPLHGAIKPGLHMRNLI